MDRPIRATCADDRPSSERPAAQACSEGRELRTPNRLIWSQTRCRCAIAPLGRLQALDNTGKGLRLLRPGGVAFGKVVVGRQSLRRTRKAGPVVGTRYPRCGLLSHLRGIQGLRRPRERRPCGGHPVPPLLCVVATHSGQSKAVPGLGPPDCHVRPEST